MDPNEALRQIRATRRQMLLEDRTPLREGAELFNFVQHARDLMELIHGLDEWLSNDGVLPADWLAEEDRLCLVEHGDWTGPHVRITSCPVVP
jgi:hypothetical protein